MDFSSSCKVHINLDADHAHTYTSLDAIKGQINLALAKDTTVKSVIVKLEGVVSTRFDVPDNEYHGARRRRGERRNSSDHEVSEQQKILYETVTVFPPRDIQDSSQSGIFTLKAGKYSYTFDFQIPLTASYSSLPPSREVRDNVLPPTFTQMGDFAKIHYFVKCTVNRAGMFNVNARCTKDFNFSPIETSSALDLDRRVWFVRRQVTIPLPDSKSSYYVPSTDPHHGAKAWRDHVTDMEKSRFSSRSQSSAESQSSLSTWEGIKKQTENIAKTVDDNIPGGVILTAVSGKAYNAVNGVVSRMVPLDAKTEKRPRKVERKEDRKDKIPYERTLIRDSGPSSNQGNSFTRGFKNVMGMNSWKGATGQFFFEIRGLANDRVRINESIPFKLFIVFDQNEGHRPPNKYPVEAFYLTTLICTLFLTVNASAEGHTKTRRHKLDFFKARLDVPLLLSDAVQRPGNPSVWDLQIPSEVVNHVTVPQYVSPSFHARNIAVSYEIEIAAAFTADQNAREEFVSVTNPVTVSSGKRQRQSNGESSTRNDGFSPPPAFEAGERNKHDLPPSYSEV